MNATKYISLTFDDGPSDTTTLKVLDKLKKYNIVGSFFLVGENIPGREHIVKKALDLGCDLQNHSLTHSDMRTFDKATIESEIDETTKRITALCGHDPQFFRPPYIYVNDLMQDTIPLIFISGYPCNDWMEEVGVQKRIDLALSGARDGAVVLLHDFEGNEATVEALDTIIPTLQAEGYEFVTITELFKRAGIDFSNAKREIYSYTDQ